MYAVWQIAPSLHIRSSGQFQSCQTVSSLMPLAFAKLLIGDELIGRFVKCSSGYTIRHVSLAKYARKNSGAVSNQLFKECVEACFSKQSIELSANMETLGVLTKCQLQAFTIKVISSFWQLNK